MRCSFPDTPESLPVEGICLPGAQNVSLAPSVWGRVGEQRWAGFWMKLSPRAEAVSQGGRGPAGRDIGLPTSWA